MAKNKKPALLKIFTLVSALSFSICGNAQCDPATIKKMPTIYNKKYESSYKVTPEQEKYLTANFTTVVEPAIKATHGLTGNWKPLSNFEITPEGFSKSVLESYLGSMDCKNNKIVKRDEEGLVVNIIYNSFKSLFKSEIAIESSHEETVYQKFDESKTIYVNETSGVQQVYFLQPSTKTTLPNVVFYRKTEDGEYYVIARTNVPLFISLTLRQALEINVKNNQRQVAELKKHAMMPVLQPEKKADYEKRMAKDFAEYRKTMPNPEKFITDLIKQLEETKLAAIKQEQLFIESYSKSIALVSEYLQKTAVNELDKPFTTGNTSYLSGIFINKTDITENTKNTNTLPYGSFITLNPAYFNKQASKMAPQFISVELRMQGANPEVLKAFTDFKANFNLGKLL